MKLLNDQRGVVIAYLTVFFTVIAVSVIWILFNEVILNVGDFATSYGMESMEPTYSTLTVIWRATPFVMLIGAIMGAVSAAHKQSLGGG